MDIINNSVFKTLYALHVITPSEIRILVITRSKQSAHKSTALYLCYHKHSAILLKNILYTNGKLRLYEIKTILSSWNGIKFAGLSGGKRKSILSEDVYEEIRKIEEDQESYVAQFRESLIPYDYEDKCTKFPFINANGSFFIEMLE